MNKSVSRFVRRGVLLGVTLVAVVMAAGCGATSEPDDTAATDASVRVVEPGAAAELIDDGNGRVVIDVRTPEEFDEAHLDGAMLIDFYRDDFESAISELDRDQQYVIYCRSGNRSGQARALMADLGFTDVVDIDGGIQAWQAEGLPTVK